MGKHDQAPKANDVKVLSVSALNESDKLLVQEAENAIISSIETARSFCKILIELSSGAIPIYFAVLKILGVDKVPAQNPIFAIVIASPAILFLASVVITAWALIPSQFPIRSITLLEDYKDIRKKIFMRLRHGMRIGFSCYAAGLLIAFLAFIKLLLS